MAFEAQDRAVRRAVAALRGHGVVPGIAGPLGDGAASAAAAARDTVLAEVPAYSESANPELEPRLADHVDELVGEIRARLGAGNAAGFDFVHRHAERAATERFPLEALLHAYRCAHKVLFPWIRDAGLACAPETAHVRRVVAAAADFAIEFIDAASTIATASYVDRTRTLAEAESDRRAELLNLLLQGYDEADTRAAQLLRRAGYLKQRQSYCVVAARSANPDEMRSAARAQRMVDAIAAELAKTSLRVLAGVRDNTVVAIVSATRRLSGWTAPQSSLAERLVQPLSLVGPAALIGLSNDVPSTSYIPRAWAEAGLALDFARYDRRVMPYSSLSLRQLVVAEARKGLGPTLPPWYRDLAEADARARGKLGATLRAYAEADMNVLRAAKALSVHPNTIYARAQRISDITGKNPLGYHDLTEMLLALECWPE